MAKSTRNCCTFSCWFENDGVSGLSGFADGPPIFLAVARIAAKFPKLQPNQSVQKLKEQQCAN
jgi:hypothetical protein